MILSTKRRSTRMGAMAGLAIFYLRQGYGSLLKWLSKTAVGIAALAIFFATLTVTLDTLGCATC
jgi:hypothetical protein